MSIEFSGDSVPGGVVIADAIIDIQDGSTLESILWSQVAGAPAGLTGTATATATVTLGSVELYRDHLMATLAGPPVSDAELPPHIPPVAASYSAGLQDRFGTVAVDPKSLRATSVVTLQVEVVTSSGVYPAQGDINTALPWRPGPGLGDVPTSLPVLLHGAAQASYDWSLVTPPGAGAALTDPTARNPEFTPDLPGLYEVSVTDLAVGGTVTIPILAGSWLGVIAGQNPDGLPIADAACTGCHDGASVLDAFTPWSATGHARIFSDTLNTNSHLSPSCFACHAVGYETSAVNGGLDDAADYQAFLDSGLLSSTGDDWTTMLAYYPDSARLANIQCDNCHGPHDSGDHIGRPARTSLAAGVCATCHGDPLRHGRFQQWQLSGHAAYAGATAQGLSGNCSRCHAANGFLAWLPNLASDPVAPVLVTWTEDEVHSLTCVTCHDPHATGTTSGSFTNAPVRIMGDTPELLAGFTAVDVGRGAVCITCHNSARGLRNDATYDPGDAARAPHASTQGDVLMGENAYFVATGTRGLHAEPVDTCVDCHMEATPPPPPLSYAQGGTNHAFWASRDICSECHTGVTAEDVQIPVQASLDALRSALEAAILGVMNQQIAAGGTIDLDGQAVLSDLDEVTDLEFLETGGRHGIVVTLVGGSVVGPLAMTDVEVVPPTGPAFGLYDAADPSVPKAGWNWLLLTSDGSVGVHNPAFANAVLDASLTALPGEMLFVDGFESGTTDRWSAHQP